MVVSEEFIDLFVEKGAFIGWYFNYIPIGREPEWILCLLPSRGITGGREFWK
ncbi:MAG: hypothetical protein U5N58_00730 [Actinomycetota bacterium]|nr:hypothetical protein [Actinomycetota bacterium]